MPRSRADTCARQIRKVCAGLPEAEERSGGHDERHLAFTVRRRTFGYLTNDHHGDGRLALICRAPPGEQSALVAAEPDRFFVPPYLGHRGWVGLWLDGETPDWSEVRELLIESYCLSAPARLAAVVEARLPALAVAGHRHVRVPGGAELGRLAHALVQRPVP